MHAPITYGAVQAFTLLIYVTYGGRILLYLLDKFIEHRGQNWPHIATITVKSMLSISQGGFSCAGPLDKHQPATQLDLMLIPTVAFQPGMYAEDDAVCGVCLGEYSQGEILRVLNCSHHFHQQVCHREPSCTSGAPDRTAGPTRGTC